MAKNILSKTEFRQIKKARIRHEGKKVVTDDIKKLKSLAIEAIIEGEDKINYYREPVEIEYYIPKESRFQVDTKYLYIQLVDPEPLNETQRQLFEYFRAQDRVFDIVEVMNSHPQYLMNILESYEPKLNLLEKFSIQLKAGQDGDDKEYKSALYMLESLRRYEPTLCALEILGDYSTLAMNQIIRILNKKNIEFFLEDETVSYMIKLNLNYFEKNGIAVGERFEILMELFYQQAFPNRGAVELDDLLV